MCIWENKKQAGAELGQAQVKLEVVDKYISWSVVEVAALVVVEVGAHYFFSRVGGCIRWN